VGIETYTYPDGSKYEGEWQDNKRHGRGIWTRPDGMRYEGEWENDKPSGQGTLTAPDGRKRVGEWKDGKFVGEIQPAVNLGQVIQELEKENRELKDEVANLRYRIYALEKSKEFGDMVDSKAEPPPSAKSHQTRNNKTRKKKTWWLLAAIIFALFVFIIVVNAGGEEPIAGPNVPVEEEIIEEVVEEAEEAEEEVIEEVVEEIGSVLSGTLEVHFIDVGQGDSILIITPMKNILIDGGDRGNTALNYIRNQGIQSLDYIISTHPHADHIGGLINVIQSIPIGEVIDPAVVHTTQTFEDYLTIIDQKGIIYTEGRADMKWDLGGGANMQVLHPTSPSSSDLNNASIVIRLTYGEVSFLFTGDAESAAEKQILSRGYELNSTILKVGHHGSKTSTSQAFLTAVKPEAAIIMCSKTNSYGHPHQETLNKLSAANVDIYRTDLHGNIVFVTDGKTYSVNKEPYSYAENQQPPPTSENVPATIIPMVILGEFVGSKNSDKYHYPSCSYAESIKESNRIWFDSVQAAAAAGYVACKGCNPPSIVAPPPAPEPSPAPSTTQAAFVGSKNSDKYHYPSCGHAKKIKPENLRTFNSVAEARAAGYSPCGTCKPPQ
jgi:competence protein ComEC